MRPVAVVMMPNAPHTSLIVVTESGVRFYTNDFKGGEAVCRLHPFDSDLQDLEEWEARMEELEAEFLEGPPTPLPYGLGAEFLVEVQNGWFRFDTMEDATRYAGEIEKEGKTAVLYERCASYGPEAICSEGGPDLEALEAGSRQAMQEMGPPGSNLQGQEPSQ